MNKEFTLVAVLFLIASLATSLATVWVSGSLITSGVKVAKDDCGQTYSIEEIFNGDWFCPTETDSITNTGP